MKLQKLANIIIPDNRQRSPIKESLEGDLAESILRRVGLLHPVVITENASGAPVLLAGFRRLSVIKLIHEAKRQFFFEGNPVPPGFIPVTTLEEMSPVEFAQAELDENFSRLDLNFRDQCAARALIHRLRCAQDPDHTAQSTARELGLAPGSAKVITDSVLVHDNFHRASVRNSRSFAEARNNLLRELEAELAQQVGAQGTAFQREAPVLLFGSAQEEMKKLAAKGTRVDCIITDPPYGINIGSSGHTKSLHSYVDDEATSSELYLSIISLGKQLMPEGHLYLFCDIRRFPEIAALARANGFLVWNFPIIWYKGTQSGAPDILLGPRHTYETILFATHGNVPLRSSFLDCITHIPATPTEHPAGKPPELYKYLLSSSCLPGSTVLDPCCGGGPVFPAAKALGLHAIGIEKEKAYYAMAWEMTQ